MNATKDVNDSKFETAKGNDLKKKSYEKPQVEEEVIMERVACGTPTFSGGEPGCD